MNYFQYLFFLERFEKRAREITPNLTRTDDYFCFEEHGISFQYDFDYHLLTILNHQIKQKDANPILDLILKSLKDVKKIKNVEINCLIQLSLKDKKTLHSYGTQAKNVAFMLKKIPFLYTIRGFVPNTYDIDDLYHIDVLTQEGKINLYYRLSGVKKVFLQSFSTIEEVEVWVSDKDFITHGKHLVQQILSRSNQEDSGHIQAHCDIIERFEKNAFVYSVTAELKHGSTLLYSHSFHLHDPNGIGFKETLVSLNDEVQKEIDNIYLHLLSLEEFTKLATKHDKHFSFKKTKLVEFNLFNHPYILQLSPHNLQNTIFISVMIENRSNRELKELQIEETNVIDMKNIFIKQIETWIRSRKLVSLME